MSDNPKQQQIIRKPGSQVAPNQKPLFKADRTTASTHSRIPVHEATAGKKYRVRDKVDAAGAAIVWGEDLTHDEANKLKEQVVGSRRSRTARVEEMPPPDGDELAELEGAPSDAFPAETVHVPVRFAESSGVLADPTVTITDVPLDLPEWSDAQLRVWMGLDPARWAKAFVIKSAIVLEEGDDPFDLGFVVSWFAGVIDVAKSSNQLIAPNDPQLELAKKKALAAAAPVAAQAQARAVKPIPVPVPTAKPSAKKPVLVSDPPKPPPSPLSDEEIPSDGPAELPPDEELLDSAAISDISSEVGGGPSDADKTRARDQAAKDATDTTASAIGAYAAATKLSDAGPWPTWEQLGEFEHAAWRFYVAHGGAPPELVKQPRKVTHAMGVVS